MSTSTEISLPDAPRSIAPTSEELARILFGRQQYMRYLEWLEAIDRPDEACFYETLREWESLRKSTSVEIGDLPLPNNYKAFRRRIRGELFTSVAPNDAARDAPGIRPVAELCGHALHPGNPDDQLDICPPCTMEDCITSLQRIAEAWQCTGGPHMRPNTPLHLTQSHHTIKKIWYIEKTQWANFVHKFHQYAEMERKWEVCATRQGRDISATLQQTHSCAAALALAKQIPFLEDGWNIDFVPQPLPTTKPSSVPVDPALLHPYTLPRIVADAHFTPTLTRGIHPGPIFLKKLRRVMFAGHLPLLLCRPPSAFHRTSPYYERGRYASPASSEWDDTNLLNTAAAAADDEEISYDSDDDEEMSCDEDEDEDADHEPPPELQTTTTDPHHHQPTDPDQNTTTHPTSSSSQRWP
ncbi:hypothetical protein ACN47E_001234 [Coniothyrium glycines]